jgi:putative hydrolase
MKSNPFDRRYLFHFHTDFTDGKLSVKDYFDYAAKSDIDTLVFLEHIRREPNYDIGKFISEIRECGRSHTVEAIIGFEAKLLPDGDLDISEEHHSLANVIGIAEHSFPDQPEVLNRAFVEAVDKFRSCMPQKILVWVHPGLWFKRRGLMPHDQPIYHSMMKYARSAGVFVERNLRHDLISSQDAQKLGPGGTVTGADAHRLEDLYAWRENTRLLRQVCIP